ncbi:acyl-CoA dehydratase activase [uncultured Ellagibacter sp.]|uniref:acyl-CoA dehydratase activase n=1 Tax=uncultured Ellagibacter sp. TaxID=2137580 RepID=UPI0025CCEBDC|nr:acyl-CoA dehydratase activase [uncultured Ellagibacter sp.]
MIASTYHLGIDVGSTTAKAVVFDPLAQRVLFSRYVRHNAHQVETVATLLRTVAKEFPGCSFRLVTCGSGGTTIADALGVPFVQEVVANSLAVRRDHENVRCAIELGGQDAKMVFFERDEKSGATTVADMRMNGSCAGGTGAFIDEMAALLKVPVEQFDELAARGQSVHQVSGRCGVYAKTDIQPLLNQGVSKEDLALSSFHAIAKQTIGGLAQGLDIHPPVIFEGGPLTFNPTLVRVFAERLDLTGDDIVIPQNPETIVALGAALAADELFADNENCLVANLLDAADALDKAAASPAPSTRGTAYFASDEERAAWEASHALASQTPPDPVPGSTVRAYLGIDSGSTTTKFALVSPDGKLVNSFYAPNEGEPLDVARAALIALRDRYRAAGATLDILGVGTTGYGELMFAKAFGADYHTVETVAHARAAEACVPDASFVLDIGGQDMKALWLDGGIITDIVVNEACSSGCGSFLENFASSLNIPVEGIAQAAFSSTNPAVLGSRCTVFMTSSIVSEQRCGKTPADIMAGLCRSIIENAFTKVIRISNLESLGKKVVVQGGTFLNDAVLRALEQHIGREVTRAPYPGLMGAIGIALLTQEHLEGARRERGEVAASLENANETNENATSEGREPARATAFSLDALDAFSYTQESNLICPFCANHCNRTRITFANGDSWVTGNRCPRGEVVGDPKDKSIRDQVKRIAAAVDSVPNLFDVREKLLFRDWPCTPNPAPQNTVIGMPRVLSMWEYAPFWTTLFRSLGFTVKLSRPSTRAMYERGLAAVSSDTVCFPAKLVHGHVRDLADQGVDRIFMPSVTTVTSENTAKTSQSMCAVVKGYPIVMRNSDNPEKRFGIPFDAPLFHWLSQKDRDRQLTEYLAREFSLDTASIRQAIGAADAAQKTFKAELAREGERICDQVEREGSFAVVLASRPYQNDDLVNHELPRAFTELGIPVICADAVPHVNEVDLSRSRLDVVNNFHARMLGSAVIAAGSPNLEYVQLVSFGCGHDAYLSDEIIRLMHLAGPKAPLILKVDESDIQGPLRIRVRSFIETIRLRRKKAENEKVSDREVAAPPAATPEASASAPTTTQAAATPAPQTRKRACELPDPYPQKFTKANRQDKVVLIPNTSHAFCRLMSVAFESQGLRTIPLEIGREEAIRLGKQYVHNDICFPAQIVIGEALAALRSGKYDPDKVAVGTGKYIGDCRLTHYEALLRKALDDAGYPQVPIITNDDVDFHNVHPGFKMNVSSALKVAFTLPMIDALEELLRKMRPYETEPGAADRAFDEALDLLMEGLRGKSLRSLKRGFSQAIDAMKKVPYDRTHRKPQVLIVGEYLLNFHPGANHDVELYLEHNGLEVIEARMTDVIRKTYFYQHAQEKEYRVTRPLKEKAWHAVADNVFDVAHNVCDSIACAHPLYEPPCRMPDLVRASDPIIHHTFDAGEGVLIPGEILHHAAHGCTSFLILQPFGCLPNHVVGRGIAKRLKELYPQANILPLDYDPDVSFANIENRLQMLILSAKGAENSQVEAEKAPACAPQAASSAVSDAALAVASAADSAAYAAADVAAHAIDAGKFAAKTASSARSAAGAAAEAASDAAAAKAADTAARAHEAAARAHEAAEKAQVAASAKAAAASARAAAAAARAHEAAERLASAKTTEDRSTQKLDNQASTQRRS